MVDTADTDAVSYSTLLTDPALVSVFAISAVAALGTNAVPVALPVVGETFGLTETAIGLVISAFSVAVLVTIPVDSILADVFGRRAVVIPSLLLLGAAGLATLGVTSYEALLALSVVQGVGFAGTLPLTTTLTGDLYTGPDGSAAQGMRSGLNGLTSAVAPVVAGVLAVVAWQYPFALFALAFPVAVLVYRYYPEPEGAGGREAGPGTLASELAAYWRSIRAAADGTLALLYAGGFVLFFIKAGFRTFLPVFVVSSLGSTVTAAGTVLGVYGVTRVIVSPLAGSVMLRLGRRASMVSGVGVASLGMAAIPFAPDLWLLGAAAACYAVGEAVLNPVVNDAVAAFADPAQRAGIMSGLQISKNAALTVAPAVVGVLIGAAGFRVAFLLTAALGVGYAAAMLVAYAPASGTFSGG